MEVSIGGILRNQSLIRKVPVFIRGEATSPLYAWAVLIAGFFVLLALSLSSCLLFEHLTSYTKPEEQKWLMAVIFMVPIYSIDSFISLWNPKLALEFDILRNCYEAFALYCFGCYLMACLGGDDRVVEFLERQANNGPRTPLLFHSGGKAVVKHPMPLNFFLLPWSMGQNFYDNVKFGIVQYMILKTVCAFLALILEILGLYGEGEFKWHFGYPYITIVMNFSQTWALYCLLQFYSITKDELQPINPLAKFICFKSIVFATWWQGVLIAVICYASGVQKSLPLGANFQSSLQDFIICVEMAAAAVAHAFIFPASPYQLANDNRHAGVSVLADYASWDLPLDPEEVKESEKAPIVRFPPSDSGNIATSLKASFQDVVFVGGEQVVHDVKATVSQAVEPMEKGITRLNKTLQNLPWGPKHREKEKRRRSKDDTCFSPSCPSERSPIRGIDDPLLTGSMSDSMIARVRRHREPSGDGESSGESSDRSFGGFRTSGQRWTVKR